MKGNLVEIGVSAGKLVSSHEAITKATDYTVTSEIPVVIAPQPDVANFRFVTDGSYKYDIPPTCAVRASCAEDIILTLANYLGYEVGSVASQQILDEWSADISAFIGHTSVLVDLTAGKTLKYGHDWLFEVATNSGDFDRIVLTTITSGHEMVFMYGLWPADEVAGQGTTDLRVNVPQYHDGLQVFVLPVERELEGITLHLVDTQPNEFRLRRESYWPEHLVTRWPEFVTAITEYFDTHRLWGSGGYHLREEKYDVSTVEPSILDKFADQYVNGFPADRMLLKNSQQVWSTKGSVAHAKFVASLFGARVDSYELPSRNVARTWSAEFPSVVSFYLVQLDQLDVNGLSHLVERLPSDPPPFAAAQLDQLEQLDEKVITGRSSGISATVEFVGYEEHGGVRMARFTMSSAMGGFEPLERITSHDTDVMAYVVPVCTAARVISGGTGYHVGGHVAFVEAASDNLFTITQVDETGRVLAIKAVSPAILIWGSQADVMANRYGSGLTVEPIVTSVIGSDYEGEPGNYLNHAVLPSIDEWHQMSYRLVTDVQAGKWAGKFEPLAHPAGRQRLVEFVAGQHVVTDSSDQVVSDGTDWVVLEDKYWPEIPHVITGGKLDSSPVMLIDYDTREEQLFTSGKWAVVSRVSPRQWKIFHDCEWEQTSIITSVDGEVVADRGTFVRPALWARPLAASGMVSINGVTSCYTGKPTELAGWQTNKTTRLSRVSRDLVGWEGVKIENGINTTGTIDASAGRRLVCLFDRRVSVKMVARQAGASHHIGLAATMGQVVKTEDDGGQVMQIVGMTSSKVRSSNLYVLMVDIDWATTDEVELQLVVNEADGLWYAGVIDRTDLFMPVTQASDLVIQEYELAPGDECMVDLFVHGVEAGTTLARATHPEYEMLVAADDQNVWVEVNGQQLASTPRPASDFRAFFMVGHDQTLTVKIAGKVLFESVSYHTPQLVQVGRRFVAWSVNSAKTRSKSIIPNVKRFA